MKIGVADVATLARQDSDSLAARLRAAGAGDPPLRWPTPAQNARLGHSRTRRPRLDELMRAPLLLIAGGALVAAL